MTPGIVHDVAKSGFGQGTNELYDKARPSYQAVALAHIHSAVPAGPLNIVEIGAGTGIFTRALLARPEWTDSIRTLTAIEPSEGMRQVFSKTVSDPRISVAPGAFDHTGVEDGTADLVVIAQAFHWCPDYDAAAVEFARVLKPGGVVALIWNLEDRDAAAWVAQLRDTIEQHEKGTPQFRLGLWRQLFDTPSYQKYFQPPEETSWAYSLPGSLDIVTDRALSKSYIAVLPADDKVKVKADIEAIVKKGDGKKWIDESEGTFEYPYKTFVVIFRQK
ncbi:S-adenosyl-L-methionine-dependent methyltransferase [Auriscalpium vulgare]|uniref:S-adenosyl-L-methionine-dependent methyltransferase n=1 Tax=Auriscalpium vulgare TaxID=40419 RepID=A0ACB8SDU7_9AGAM|nr:S-adenosyl-L-methionine-dependent methyltransferase [Auriscalpium vulgare]